jgi:hypothetical protein
MYFSDYAVLHDGYVIYFHAVDKLIYAEYVMVKC